MIEPACLLLMSLMFNVSLSLMMSFVKHYSLLQPFSTIGNLLKKTVLVFVLYTVASVLIDTVLGVFIYSNHLPREAIENEIKGRLNEMSQTPLRHTKSQFLLAVFQNITSLAKYSLSNLQSKICFAIIVAFVFAETLLAIILNIKILYEIYYGEGLPSAHKLQMMVYKTFCISTVTFMLFFVFPGLVVFMGIVGIFPSHYPMNCMHFLIGLQAPSIILNIILTIKPYRTAAKRIVSRMTGKVADGSSATSHAVPSNAVLVSNLTRNHSSFSNISVLNSPRESALYKTQRAAHFVNPVCTKLAVLL
ncbi:hypothetical protein DdX_22392 [Ditylenchus destructor]|uniref:Uncharacterized protein n=1 Tax=Ditylenchus destructor TaxID=166010 RepID=A0AAD4QSI7_9BILA|nr:hypothetical protein DdX_22392 [Ditylenchus destructor]